MPANHSSCLGLAPACGHHRPARTRTRGLLRAIALLVVAITVGGLSAARALATGACCFSDGSCNAAQNSGFPNFQDFCNTGFLISNTTCSPNPCPQPTGACCFGSGSCSNISSGNCSSSSGSFRGVGSSCGSVVCTGACCQANGSCLTSGPGNCTGNYLGTGSSCGSVTCPQPTGACCDFFGNCTIQTLFSCGSNRYVGNFSTCGTGTCVHPGACCVNGACTFINQNFTPCSGTFGGADVTCSPNPCTQVACCAQGGCTLSVDGACAAGSPLTSATTCTPNPCPFFIKMNSPSTAGCTTSNSLTVTIDITGGTQSIAGGQFRIGWDSSRLTLSNAVAGAGLSIFFNVPAGAGGEDIAVRIPDGGGLVGDQTMLTLTFNISGPAACGVSGLVFFRPTAIPTRLTDNIGNDLNAVAVDLPAVTINRVAPVFPSLAHLTFSADAGACGSSVRTLTAPSVSDSCGAALTPTASVAGTPITFPSIFPQGDTTVTWTATDACGNTGTATQVVTVSNLNSITATVELDGVSAGPLTRCIRFDFYTSGCTPAATVSTDVSFTSGAGSVSFTVPCGSYSAITATDPLHTLRRTGLAASANFGVSGHDYFANFTGATGKKLLGGNANNDGYVDILDFGAYIGQFGATPPPGSSACGYSAAYRNADFSGNGSVGTEDFTFVQSNFLKSRDTDPCGGSLADAGPVSDISVADLVARGMGDLAQADFNLDGRVNGADVAWVAVHGLPRCSADFNDDQTIDVQDIFAYLNAWFMDHPRADMNASGATDVGDIFAFINTWFVGC